MNFGQRLRKARKHADLNQTQLAERLGIKQPSVSELETGESQSSKLGYQAAKVCGVSADWLVMGVGSMLDEDSPGVAETPSEYEYATIPQYNARAAAGDGHMNGHVEIKGGLAFKRDWLARLGLKPENLRVIYAEGDSMADTILDGEVMLVDISDREPRNGKIYAFLRPDGEVSVKRLIRRSVSGSWLIASDNPDKRRFPDEEASPDALHEIPIIGRVAWRGGGL